MNENDRGYIPRGRLAAAARSAYSRSGRVSPRVAAAARLYSSGAAPTKRAAAKAVGLSPEWFTALTNANEQVSRIVDDVDAAIHDQSVDMSSTLRTIGREAISKIRALMAAKSEEIQLRAATDLADRSSETSKVQKHQMVAPSLDPESAKELAKALVDAARVRGEYAGIVKGDYVHVEDVGRRLEAGDGQSEKVRIEQAATGSEQGQSGSSQSPAEVSEDAQDAKDAEVLSERPAG